MKTPYAPGSRVVIRRNPHHPPAEDVVGRVVSLQEGAGFMGCDLVEVRYENPRDGQVYERPFATANLSPGEPRVLLEMAERYEGLAAQLRALAEGERA